MRTMRIQQIAVVMAAAMLAACGDGVEGPGYKGVPLAKLTGKLSAAPGVAVSSGVRLALAWYPFPELAQDAEPGGPGTTAAPMTQPKSISTQDVVYQGQFPLAFTFDVYSPPPASALADYSASGGPQRAAIGLLLAYEDRNANQKLDVIPATGSPIDAVVGASASFLPSETAPMLAQYAVLYIEGAIAADNFGLQGQPLVPGFNLVKMLEDGDGEVVPLTTSIGIELQNNSALNLLVCDALFVPATGVGTLCGIVVGQPAAGMHIAVNAELVDGVGQVAVYLLKLDPAQGPVAVTNAEVELNGRRVPYDQNMQVYALNSSQSLLVAGAQHTVTVQAPGETATRLVFALPGDFAVTAPTENAPISASAPYAVNWTASSGADQYSVAAGCDGEPGDLDSTTALTISMPARVQTCLAGTVEVRAWSQEETEHSVLASVVHHVAVEFVP